MIDQHSEIATATMLRTNSSNEQISTGLSTPLVLLSLCSLLASPEGDPLALHTQLCSKLVVLCHALLSSPQMLFRLLAAKSLARLTHPDELEHSIQKVLLRLKQPKQLSMNTIHGLLLQMKHLQETNERWNGWIHVQEVLVKMKERDGRVENCSCMMQIVEEFL